MAEDGYNDTLFVVSCCLVSAQPTSGCARCSDNGTKEFFHGRSADDELIVGFSRKSSVFLALKKIIDPTTKKTDYYIDYRQVMSVVDGPPTV